MVKDYSDSERGNPLPPHGYSIRLAARVLSYATVFVALAGTRNTSMNPPLAISMVICHMSEVI